MTGPALSPPPPELQPPPPMVPPPMAPVAAAPVRPGGVTYACVLSIVLGSLGALAGVALFTLAAFLSWIPVPGLFFGASGGLLGPVCLAMRILGIVEAPRGLKGEPWTRWTMVVLFAIG